MIISFFSIFLAALPKFVIIANKNRLVYKIFIISKQNLIISYKHIIQIIQLLYKLYLDL